MGISIRAYFDGRSKNDLAVGAWYYTVYFKKAKHYPKQVLEVKKGWDYCYNANSNQAEIIGLISLLDDLRVHYDNLNLDKIMIFGDCLSLIKQVKRPLKQNKVLTDYYLVAQELLSISQAPIEIFWIPREHNNIANQLCRKAWQTLWEEHCA